MKKVFFFLILFIITIIIIIISSCQYFTLLSQKEWEELSGNEDDVIIYVGGAYDGGGGTSIPCYWKIKDDNIERFDLEYVSGGANEVGSIYVVGDTVYCSGVFFNGSTSQACFWINKERHNLPVDDPGQYSFAPSIKVNDGTIFTAASENFAGAPRGFHWIGESRMQYPSLIQYARSVFVHNVSSSKHTIYIGGQNLNGYACYQKDGFIHDLPEGGAANSEVFSIYVIGNTVYSAGTLDGTQSCLWINDNLILLPNGTYAYSVFVSNDDVYCAGSSGGLACYWKNSKDITISSVAGSMAYSVYVFNDNVYTAGIESGFACYWKNNKIEILEDTLNSTGNSIIIKSNNNKK